MAAELSYSRFGRRHSVASQIYLSTFSLPPPFLFFSNWVLSSILLPRRDQERSENLQNQIINENSPMAARRQWRLVREVEVPVVRVEDTYSLFLYLLTQPRLLLYMVPRMFPPHKLFPHMKLFPRSHVTFIVRIGPCCRDNRGKSSLMEMVSSFYVPFQVAVVNKILRDKVLSIKNHFFN